jgi:hypothetical protein
MSTQHEMRKNTEPTNGSTTRDIARDGKLPFAATIPDPENLSDDERKAAESGTWPVRISFPSTEVALQALGRGRPAPSSSSPLADVLVAELLSAVTRNPELVRQLISVVAPVATRKTSTGPMQMTMADYARRTAYAKRTIEKFLSMGMPSVGKGRLRRIPVEAADEWLRTSMAVDEVAIEAEARLVARNTRHRRRG